MFGPSCAGIREGRTATKPFPDLPVEVIADQLAACGHDPKDPALHAKIHARIMAETVRPLWSKSSAA